MRLRNSRVPRCLTIAQGRSARGHIVLCNISSESHTTHLEGLRILSRELADLQHETVHILPSDMAKDSNVVDRGGTPDSFMKNFQVVHLDATPFSKLARL